MRLATNAAVSKKNLPIAGESIRCHAVFDYNDGTDIWRETRLYCREMVFSGHAVRRMSERQISQVDVGYVIAAGETIADYPNDNPYPSSLILGFVRDRPLHVVVAVDQRLERCYVVTVYVPSLAYWQPDYRTR
ncbi:MAG: DUF4258 domain-containing protein [Candidatus Zipacnadales bacterium]